MDSEDEEFAHGANGNIGTGTCKTARRRPIASHYEFASHRRGPAVCLLACRFRYILNGLPPEAPRLRTPSNTKRASAPDQTAYEAAERVPPTRHAAGRTLSCP